MKLLPNINYDNKDHKVIEQAKKIHGGNWHDFVLDLSKIYIEIKLKDVSS